MKCKGPSEQFGTLGSALPNVLQWVVVAIYSHSIAKNQVLILIECPNNSVGLSFDGGPDLLSWGEFLANKSQGLLHSIPI